MSRVMRIGVGVVVAMAACFPRVVACQCQDYQDTVPALPAPPSNRVLISNVENLVSSPDSVWLGQALPVLVRAGLVGIDGLVTAIGNEATSAHEEAASPLGPGDSQSVQLWTISGRLMESHDGLKVDLTLRGGKHPVDLVFSKTLDNRRLLSDFAGVMAEIRATLGSSLSAHRTLGIVCFRSGHGLFGPKIRSIGADLALGLTSGYPGHSTWAALPWTKSSRFCEQDGRAMLGALPEVDGVLGGSVEIDGQKLLVRPVVTLRVPEVELTVPMASGTLADYSGLETALLATASEFMKALGDREPWNVDLLSQHPLQATGYLDLADAAAGRKNPDLESVLLELAIEKDPKLFAALSRLGRVRVSQRRYKEAERYLSEAQQIKPDDPVIDEALGDLYFATNVFSQSAVFYQRALTGAESRSALSLKLGESYYLLEDYERALKALETSRLEQEKEQAETVISGDSKAQQDTGRCMRARTFVGLGQIYRAKHDLRSALDWYQKAVAVSPGYARAEIALRSAYFERAKVAAAADNWNDAKGDVESALQYRPNAEVYELATIVLRKLGEYDAMLKLLERAAKENVSSASLSSNAGYALVELSEKEKDEKLKQDKLDEALRYTEQAIAMLPTAAVLYINKAEVLNRQHRSDLGIAVLQGAIDRFGPTVDLSRKKAELLISIGSYEAAWRTLDAIDIRGLTGTSLAKILAMKAAVLEDTRGCIDALEWYDKALVASPSEIENYFGKAFCLNQIGKYEDALAVAEAALKMDPASIHALNHKAYALYHLGKAPEALKLSAEVTAAEPGYAIGHFNRARILAAEGSMDEALGELAVAAKSLPARVRKLAESAPEFALVKDRADFARALNPQ